MTNLRKGCLKCPNKESCQLKGSVRVRCAEKELKKQKEAKKAFFL